jgi:hypothetical protein
MKTAHLIRHRSTHYEVGSDVRETIKRQGGPLPEDLPTPEKSIRQLEKEQKREEQKRIERQRQPELPLLLDEVDSSY